MSGWQRQLVRRIRMGDPVALGELYDRFAGPVYRVAHQLTGSISAAEEITKAVFVGAWRSPELLVRHQDRLPEHLAHCAHNRAVTWRGNRGASWPVVPMARRASR